MAKAGARSALCAGFFMAKKKPRAMMVMRMGEARGSVLGSGPAEFVASCAAGQGLCRWELYIPCGTSYFFILREGRERKMKELKRNALVVFMTVGLSALAGFIGYFVADKSSVMRAEKMELYCFTELKIGFDNCKTLTDIARG